MKVLIIIPDEKYHYIKGLERGNTDYATTLMLYHSVKYGIPYEETQGDLISRSALKEHKFLTPQVRVIGGRRNGKMRELIIQAFQLGWNNCIDAITDNAPAIERSKGDYFENLKIGCVACEFWNEDTEKCESPSFDKCRYER